MTNKLLVIGASGMLGRTILSLAPTAGFETVGMDVGDMDITNVDSVEMAFSKTKPDAVINAAAMTDVEGAETPEGRSLADQVNGEAVGILAEACIRHRTAFIHISTDYVFNGTSKDGVAEDEVPQESMNAYGATKRHGEKRMIQAYGGLHGSSFVTSSPLSYLIRTSWLFGTGAKNFVGKISAAAQTKGAIRVVDDEIGCPTHVADLAERLLGFLKEKPAAGIYHATGSGSCSRHDFARAVLAAQNIRATVDRASLADFPRNAHIAPMSILRNTKSPPMASWEEMVKRLPQETSTTV